MTAKKMNQFLSRNSHFDNLRDSGFRNDVKSSEFAADFLEKAQAEAKEELPALELFSWASVRKVRDFVIELTAPFAIDDFAPASLSAATSVQAGNTEYQPEIGGYMRMEFADGKTEETLLVNLWFEDHEGATPFNALTLTGSIESLDGETAREIEIENDERGILSIEINPNLDNAILFDIHNDNQPLVENLNLNFRN